MVNANSLRLGNYVIGFQNTIRKVSGILDDGQVYTSDIVNGEFTIESDNDLQGIPLSPDILLNAGFVAIEDVCIQFTDPYYKSWRNGITLAMVDDKLRLWIECDDGYYNWYWTEVKYLHQLQNLYLALTGTDLSISL